MAESTADTMSGAELIAAERERQVDEEGWTPEHDDRHVHGELAEAARCYAIRSPVPYTIPPMSWPWERSWWKPNGDRVRNLAKAGALIAAEIDRLQRVAPKEDGS